MDFYEEIPGGFETNRTMGQEAMRRLREGETLPFDIAFAEV